MDFSRISDGLSCLDGIYFSQGQCKISYPETGNEECFEIEDHSFWFVYRNKCIQFLITLFPPNQLFIDIGGGNGFVSKAILETGVCDVVLIEPGISGILNAKKRGIQNLVCSTFQNAKIKKNSLPAVGIFDVLEHIEDDQAFLNELNELIQPGGYLFITVPAYSFLWSQEDDVAGHVRRYTLRQIKKLLKRSNFEICFSSYFFMFLIFPIFFLRTLPSLFLKRKASSNCLKKDHSHSGWQSFIDLVLNLEFFFLSRGSSLPFGGSCIIVAKKIGLV